MPLLNFTIHFLPQPWRKQCRCYNLANLSYMENFYVPIFNTSLGVHVCLLVGNSIFPVEKKRKALECIIWDQLCISSNNSQCKTLAKRSWSWISTTSTSSFQGINKEKADCLCCTRIQFRLHYWLSSFFFPQPVQRQPLVLDSFAVSIAKPSQ